MKEKLTKLFAYLILFAMGVVLVRIIFFAVVGIITLAFFLIKLFIIVVAICWALDKVSNAKLDKPKRKKVR